MQNEKALQHELNKLGDRLAWLCREVAKVQGQHDQVQAQLLDLEGAHDSRVVAVR